MRRSIRFRRDGVIIGGAVLASGAVGMLAAVHGWAAIALPLVAAGGLLLLVHPVLGLLLLAGTIPLESALMFEGASAPRMIGVAVFGAWGVQKLLRREPLSPLLSPALVRLVFLFFALACLSLLWAQYPQGVERRLVLLFQLILLSVLVFDLASSWERVAWVAKMLVVAATIAALLTLEQYFIGGARRAGAGIVGGVNRTAVTLVAILPFAFYLFRSSESSIWRLLGLGYIGISAIAVAATLSRMNFLLYPSVVMLHLLLMVRGRRERRRVVLLGCAALLVVGLMPMDAIRNRALTIAPYLSQTVGPDEAGESYSGRGFHIQVGLAIFKDHPILGAGYQNYNPHFLTYQWDLPGAARTWQSPRSPHSSHVGILANLGLVGFALWMSMFALAMWYVLVAWRNSEGRGTQQAMLTHAIGIAIGLQFLYGFYGEIHQGKLFWLVLGLALVLHRLTKRRGHGPAPGPQTASSLSRQVASG